jgi:hypothetical protein
MATAQALGVDMATLFGGRKLPSPTETLPERPPTDYPPADEQPPDVPPANNNTADLAAEAAGEEPDFPEEPAGPGTPPEETEFERLSHSLDRIMISYKAELDVVSKNGRYPYKMAEEELANPSATEETRRSMIGRLRAYIEAKRINV